MRTAKIGHPSTNISTWGCSGTPSPSCRRRPQVDPVDVIGCCFLLWFARQWIVYISLSYLGLCSVQLPAFGTGRVNLWGARPHSRRLAAGEWEKTNPISSSHPILSYLIDASKITLWWCPIDLLNINQYKLYTLNHPDHATPHKSYVCIPQTPPEWCRRIAMSNSKYDRWVCLEMGGCTLFMTNLDDLPSGKRSHNYGKSPCFMGKLAISMAMFNSYVSHYP